MVLQNTDFWIQIITFAQKLIHYVYSRSMDFCRLLCYRIYCSNDLCLPKRSETAQAILQKKLSGFIRLFSLYRIAFCYKGLFEALNQLCYFRFIRLFCKQNSFILYLVLLLPLIFLTGFCFSHFSQAFLSPFNHLIYCTIIVADMKSFSNASFPIFRS